jgi:hypothetical protein
MKIEYCYDIQQDFYWLTQIKLVSHCFIFLHYVGLSEDKKLNDFWTNIYDQRCHPIGWCKENSKLMIAPSIVTQQTSLNNSITSNGNENEDINQIPPNYLFDKVNFFIRFLFLLYIILEHRFNSL